MTHQISFKYLTKLEKKKINATKLALAFNFKKQGDDLTVSPFFFLV